MAFSKIILNGVTLMDVTQDTVTTATLQLNYTATGADGNLITGSLVPSIGITPSGTLSITANGSYNVYNYATATVAEANPLIDATYGYFTVSNERKWSFTPRASVGINYGYDEGYLETGEYEGLEAVFNAIPTGISIAPSTSSQTIGGTDYMMEGPITVAAVLTADLGVADDYEYITENGVRKWKQTIGVYSDAEGGNWVDAGTLVASSIGKYNAIASGTSITPTETS